ncbi:MAG: choice-of-anchor M domain-containing protein [Actinomycetaceae bacterium]|nr:choice-of-anchor M domain-containing protein [Actinomycetaceae bacterium]
MRKRLIAGLAAAFIALAPAAGASPIDGLEVATEAHVDSPKVLWKEDNFLLQSEFHRALRPIEKTVNWAGKGKDYKGNPLHMYKVPNDPQWRLVGNPGQMLYAAPAVAGHGNKPIFSGFGADVGIPASRFRDGSFNLDLVEFSGPGEMTMFRAGVGDDEPMGILFSSTVKGQQSAWIQPGTHSHNYTGFTKPGLYKLTYRASARDTNGRFVASAPQALYWQVGGARPDPKNGIIDIAKAFAEAGETGLTTPSFSAEKLANPTDEAEEYTTVLKFNAGQQVDGRLAIFIDGYPLAEIPVKGGVGEWSEMLGTEDVSLQAVFIPAAKGAGKWVSAPLVYKTGNAKAEVTAAGDLQGPKKPAVRYETRDYVPASSDVTAEIKHDSNDGEHSFVTVTPSDPNVSFRVFGGVYENAEDNVPDCPLDFVSSAGHRTQKFASDSDICEMKDGAVVKLKLTPNSRTKMDVTEIVLKSLNEKASVKFKTAGPFMPRKTDKLAAYRLNNPGDDEGDTPDPGVGEVPAPPTGGDEPGAGENPGTGESLTDDVCKQSLNKPLSKAVTIGSGHIDIGAIMGGNSARLAIGDDSGKEAACRVWREPNSVTLFVSKHAYMRNPAEKSKSYEFMREGGSHVYLLPQDQRQDLVWPGFSTESLDPAAYPQGVTIEIQPGKMPKGAQWWAFTEPTAKGGKVGHIAAYNRTTKLKDVANVHMHMNWVFSKPGDYEVKVRLLPAGTERAGGAVDTKWHSLKFKVESKQAKPGAQKPGKDQAGDTSQNDGKHGADHPQVGNHGKGIKNLNYNVIVIGNLPKGMTTADFAKWVTSSNGSTIIKGPDGQKQGENDGKGAPQGGTGGTVMSAAAVTGGTGATGGIAATGSSGTVGAASPLAASSKSGKQAGKAATKGKITSKVNPQAAQTVKVDSEPYSERAANVGSQRGQALTLTGLGLGVVGGLILLGTYLWPRLH